ncbi:MAG: UDP-N-acetylglucosamine 1-carboxyvinyltransferase, partial [Victivallales bacterium]|nr:UDP-N-acetylglucosamine 1-carboxyvinyltransferase [Victivallales bacterium]
KYNMNRYIIHGPSRISGSITLGGNKNAALPMIAAAMLTEEPLILHNVPDILDVRNMLRVASGLGAEVDFNAGTLRIQAKGQIKTAISDELCRLTRTSFLFAGPLCAHYGHSTIGSPGGDIIGRRRLDTHVYGLGKLGMEISRQGQGFVFSCERLAGCEMFLDEASVTATEHIMLAAACAEGSTMIRNAACEPHVTQLAKLLVAMGAEIDGIDTNILVIRGTRQLHGAEMTIESDHVEAVSYLSLCAAAGGEIEIKGQISPHNYWMARRVLEKFGCSFTIRPNIITMKAPEQLVVKPDLNNAIPCISDGPWPQFPSDMMSCMITLATQAQGTVLFFEKMFESRMYFVDKLISMGANAIVCDPHRVVISGPSKLHGVEMTSPDIRAGMAMLIAACCAEGDSIVNNIDMIRRGYEALGDKLKLLGVDFEEC